MSTLAVIIPGPKTLRKIGKLVRRRRICSLFMSFFMSLLVVQEHRSMMINQQIEDIVCRDYAQQSSIVVNHGKR